MSIGPNRSIPPNAWEHIPELDADVMHLGPGNLDVLMVEGVAILSGGHWYVRRAQQRWRDPVPTEPTEVHSITMRM